LRFWVAFATLNAVATKNANGGTTMEQIYFGARIASYRKELGLTQEALAQKLGVTNQAVSKWEADQSCPDIMLLPPLADVFGISLDELFGREAPAAAPTAPIGIVEDLPWPDDEDLHAVLYQGHRLMGHGRAGLWKRKHVHVSLGGSGKEEPGVQLRFNGHVRDIYADFSVACDRGGISGDVHAGVSVSCGGSIGGDVTAGASLTCGGDVGGDAKAGGTLTCGNVGGDAKAGGVIRCSRVEGNATAGGGVRIVQNDK